ncbi:MAG: hypothetical protein CMG69_01245 [Candidatus Marinimicrobia bacterium]|nr:hypothetical protein [Candidatus Neomarinimicrobiota bacterium]|tara:strand:+ start:208 stop:579 length:372 start_codon:yes stop_codon:yes gene_type:complete
MNIKESNISDWKDKEPNQESGGKVRQKFKEYLKKTIGSIPFTEDAVALFLLFLDPEYPSIKKGVAVFALLYFITPVDLVPDTLPVVGFLDDAGIVAAAVNMYHEDIPIYREKAIKWLEDNDFR